jgi:hypothetical protein
MNGGAGPVAGGISGGAAAPINNLGPLTRMESDAKDVSASHNNGNAHNM